MWRPDPRAIMFSENRWMWSNILQQQKMIHCYDIVLLYDVTIPDMCGIHTAAVIHIYHKTFKYLRCDHKIPKQYVQANKQTNKQTNKQLFKATLEQYKFICIFPSPKLYISFHYNMVTKYLVSKYLFKWETRFVQMRNQICSNEKPDLFKWETRFVVANGNVWFPMAGPWL